MMNRIFHARISFYMYLFIALTGAMALFFLWNMMPLCGVAMLLLLIVAIERVIHTTYTFTENSLIVSYGRFQRKKELPLLDIKRVEKLRSFRMGRSCLITYLLVFYGDERQITVMPVKEDEFLETLQKRRGK